MGRTMHKMIIACALLLTAALVAPSALADFNWELNFNGGYTNNLLNETIGYDDNHSTSRAIVRYYPLGQLQLNSSVEYTYYGNLYNLSNGLAQFGAIWIPTAPESKLNLYVDGNFSLRRYRKAFSEFDENIGTAKVSLSYALLPRLRLRTGIRYNANRYPKSDTTIDADYQQGEAFAGANLTFLGSNSFDIETGFGATRFSSIDATVDSTISDPFFPDIQVSPSEFLQEGTFTAFYVSPRLSRPIGGKTGISLTYTYRKFYKVDNSVVMGPTTFFLSPWASFFDGSAVQFRVKSLAVPHMIVTAGAGYWDKTFLRTIEQVIVVRELYPGYSVTELRWVEPKDAGARKDYMTRLYLGLQRPFRVAGGAVVEPSLNLEYTHNISTSTTYRYNATAVSVGVVVRP